MTGLRRLVSRLLIAGVFAVLLTVCWLMPACGRESAPEGIDTLWTRSIGGLYSEEAQNLLINRHDELILIGTTSTFGAGGFDLYLLKLNAAGDLLWDTTYGGSRDEQGYGLAEMPDGGYAICGWTNSYGAGAEDVYLLRVTATGDTLWTRTYGGTSGDAGYDLGVTRDSGLIVLGVKGSDIYLIRTNAAGDTLWTRTYGGANSDFATALVATADDGYFIAGATNSFGAGSGDAYFLRIDQNGTILWSRTCGGSRNDWATAAAETADHGFVVAGYTESFGHGGYDVYVIRLNAQGDTLWTRTYGEDGDEMGYDVCVNADGSCVIAGTTNSYDNRGFDLLLLKIDPAGKELWRAVYGGEADDVAYTLVTDARRSYLCAGYSRSWGIGGADVYLLKTAPDQ